MKRSYSTKEAAEYIGSTEKSLRSSRCSSSTASFIGPKYRRVGTKKIIYLIEDLDEWLNNLAVGVQS